MNKARVADLVRKVENGVDEFRNYLGATVRVRRPPRIPPPPQGPAGVVRTRPRQPRSSTATAKKDDLDDALSDLNWSTNLSAAKV